MEPQQQLVPAFYYCSPEHSDENRHHAQYMQPQSYHSYAPHTMQQQQQHMSFPPVPVLPSSPLPSTPVFSRPSSSCSQPPMAQQAKPSFTSAPQQVLTPQSSPVRMHQQLHRPTIVLDTEKYESHDRLCYPQTPALSVAGSVMSSPGDMLATPLNPMFSGLDHGAMAMKESVDAQQSIEQFPSLPWHHCGSPPLTPRKCTTCSVVSTPRMKSSQTCGGRSPAATASYPCKREKPLRSSSPQ